MELIKLIGILLDYSLDLAFGAGENDFRLELSIENNECVEYKVGK